MLRESLRITIENDQNEARELLELAKGFDDFSEDLYYEYCDRITVTVNITNLGEIKNELMDIFKL